MNMIIFLIYLKNSNNNEIKINDDFWLLCICELKNIKKMSPSFINRFDVFVFENQLEGLNDNDLSSFIKFLLNHIKYRNILYKIFMDVKKTKFLKMQR